MSALQVGDRTTDDSLIILDEDRLCYKVKSVSNSAEGVRTISKALLSEWIEAYSQTPNATSNEVRKRLVGKSEVDRYEYGYSGTLAKMASMALGQIPVVHPNAEEIRQKEFYDWMVSIGKANKYAKDVAKSYLPTISDKPNPPSKSAWHGLREYLYNAKPPKRIYEINSLAELDEVYSGIDRIFGSDATPGAFDPKRFNDCWTWAHDSANHNSVSAAWNLYKQFLKWRETQKSAQNAIPPDVDRLTIALKYFSKHRSNEYGASCESYDEPCAEIRRFYEMVDGERLVSCNYEEFKKGLSVRQVANTYFGKHTGDDKRKLGDFLAGVRKVPKDISVYLDNPLDVPGFGGGGVMLTNFLMRVRPDIFVTYSEQMFESVKFLGLTTEDALPALSTDAYNTYKGIQTFIRDRMREMGIKAENGADADYLTVNEFTWFVSENQDLIKEEVMKKAFKNAPKKSRAGGRKLSEAVKGDDMMQRLMAALRTKPFAILAGHSGTGKSQLVRRLAYRTCNDEVLLKESERYNAPGNYCMVQVKPNWHDSTDLLGYYTEMNGGHYHTTPFVEFICKAYAYPETPFFVCLDEMNLAPVEQYFAEFLSAIESYSETTKLTDRLITEKAEPEEICGETKLTESLEEVKKHGLTIPRNLFVVGTVNVDETTCQFSRKVLDRAMTILMTTVSFKSMTVSNDPSKEGCLDDDGIKFFRDRPTQAALVQGQIDKLDAIQAQVGDSPFAIAYRFANEYALYQSAYQMLMEQGLKPDDNTPDPANEDLQKTALDHVVLMKLLPRIHGARTEMEVLFNGKDGDAKKTGLIKNLKEGKSVEMMNNILDRPGEYLSFWP